MDRYITAIDLGSTKVVTAVGENTSKGVKIISYKEAPSKGIIKGEIINIQNVLDSLKPTIEETAKIIGMTPNKILAGIAGQNIKCLYSTKEKRRRDPADLITTEEIEELKREMSNTKVGEGERILHVIPQSYNIDEHMNVTEPVGMEGERIEGNYLMFIGKTSSTDSCNTVIKKAGLNLDNLILEPIASGRAVLSDNEKEIGVALVDIGGATTDLIIIKDNTIRYAALIPFAGNSITEDIRQALGVPAKYAELMKVYFGACFSGYAEENKIIVLSGAEGAPRKEVSLKKLTEIIEARMSEIIATVNHEIEKSGLSNKIHGGIVLTGGSSNLAFIRHLTKAITGYQVRLAKPSNLITDDSVEEVYKASASTAVGLVLMGFDDMERAASADDDIDSDDTDINYGNNHSPSGTLFGNHFGNEDTNRKDDKKVKPPKPPKVPKPPKENKGKSLFGGIIGGIFGDITSDNDNGA